MQVFKAFIKNIKVESKRLLMYFGIFMALTIVFAKIGQDREDTAYKQEKINMAVIDEDNSELSQGLYDYLDQTQNIKTIKTDKESMADELFYLNVEYILIIKDGFGEKLLQGVDTPLLESVKLPQSTSAEFLDREIDRFVSILSSYGAAGFTGDQIVEKAHGTANVTSSVEILQKEKSDSRSIIYYYFNYIPYILICILMVGLGSILIIFREKDLEARIRCSALSLSKRNLHLILCAVGFSMFCWIIFMLLAAVIYKENMYSMKALLFMGNSFIFLIVAMGLAYLFSFICSDDSTLNLASVIVGLGMSFLGGIFVPLEFLGSTTKMISKFLPTYWYVENSTLIDSLSISNMDYSSYFRNIGIQFLFAIVFLTLALAVSRSKNGRSK